MKRVIVDYKKLTSDILDMLVTKYPDGYDDNDIISFRNTKDELIEAVEVRADDTIYLVKVSSSLEKRMVTFIDEDDSDSEIAPIQDKNISVEEN